jgi:hypothetical protein
LVPLSTRPLWSDGPAAKITASACIGFAYVHKPVHEYTPPSIPAAVASLVTARGCGPSLCTACSLLSLYC